MLKFKKSLIGWRQGGIRHCIKNVKISLPQHSKKTTLLCSYKSFFWQNPWGGSQIFV